MRHRCIELVLKGSAHQRVQAIGRDDQVIVSKLIHRLDCRVVARLNADGADARLQDGQEIELSRAIDGGSPQDILTLTSLSNRLEDSVLRRRQALAAKPLTRDA